jgi:hypothetical protein
MSKISFKTYSRIMSESTSEEELNEIFGLFKNNSKIEKLRAEREALKKKREDAKKKFDDKWNAMKKREEDEKNGGFDTRERGSGTMRSQAAQGRAAERDWVRGMTEGKLTEETIAFRHDRDALIIDLHHFGAEDKNPEGVRVLRMVLKLMGIKIPNDTLYCYNADGFPQEFTRIMRKVGMKNPSEPELIDFKNDKRWTKVKRLETNTFFKRGNMIAVVADEGDPSTRVFIAGKELVTESLDVIAESFELFEKKEPLQLAREKITNEVMPKLEALGAKVEQRGVEDFFLGGGGGREMSKFVDWLNEQSGYVDGGSSYEENAPVFKKIGVTRQMYNLFAKVSM